MNEEKKEIIYKILGLLAAGAVVAAVAVAPGTLLALAPFLTKETRADRKRVYDVLRHAQRQQWVKVLEEEGRLSLTITKKGRRRWNQLRFDRPLGGNSWDGKWRLVIFDIHNKRKDARDALRTLLKRIGFYQLQKSVWVTPWPCHDHLAAIREMYLIPRYVQVVEAAKLECEDDLLAKFNLSR